MLFPCRKAKNKISVAKTWFSTQTPITKHPACSFSHMTFDSTAGRCTAVGERFDLPPTQPQNLHGSLPTDGVRYVGLAQSLPSLPDSFIDISILSLSFPLRQIREHMSAENGHGKQLLCCSVKTLQGKTALWL